VGSEVAREVPLATSLCSPSENCMWSVARTSNCAASWENGAFGAEHSIRMTAKAGSDGMATSRISFQNGSFDIETVDTV
jgi:hypothetical protein